MNDEFKRLSAIQPYTNIKFNLNKTLKDVPKREIKDRSLMMNKMRNCINEFKHDSASHSWSTF